eukprot:2017547-Prymnesium_polylepis.1
MSNRSDHTRSRHGRAEPAPWITSRAPPLLRRYSAVTPPLLRRYYVVSHSDGCLIWCAAGSE